MKPRREVCRRCKGADDEPTRFLSRASFWRFCKASRRKFGWGFTALAPRFDECQRCAMGKRIARGEEILPLNVRAGKMR